MRPISQSQNLKVCGSCKRILHVSCFGFSRKAKDGFNSCCKECRNYRRRRSYHQSTNRESCILPLNENNKTILNDVLSSASKIEIPCLDMTSNSNLTFIVENIGGAYRFEIFNGWSNDKDIFYTGYTDLFVTIATDLLRKRNLRLFSPEQPHQILDWQFNPMSANALTPSQS